MVPGDSSRVPPSKVCDFCQNLDLQKFLDIDPTELYNEKNGFVVANAGTRYRGKDPHQCSLCQMFALARFSVEGNLGFEGHDDEIRVFSFLSRFHRVRDLGPSDPEQLFQSPDLLCLVVIPSASTLIHNRAKPQYFPSKNLEKERYLVCYDQAKQDDYPLAAQVLGRKVSHTTILKWLHFCQSHHQGKCQLTTSTIRGLQVIDCRSGSLVTAPPSCSYVALSYVWGHSVPSNKERDQSRNKTESHLSLPQVLPNVVWDAITLTCNLGFSYLWVDKYCIDQTDPELQQEQIMQMDKIYENAELTLIAAAGEDENHGLPGAGAPRPPQVNAQIGKATVTALPQDPEGLIKSSKWFTRGWTFQEGILARRRLIFTEEQVYFECDAMNCSETLSPNLDLLHTEIKTKFKSNLRSGIFEGSILRYGAFANADLNWLNSLRRYHQYVEQYSQRDLTKDEDSLNAFLGIIKHFQSSNTTPIYHIMGLPLMHISWGTEELISGLAWTHPQYGYKPIPSRLPRRRSGFPSWSWVGWAAKASLDGEELKKLPSNLENLTIELNNGELVNLEDLYCKDVRNDGPARHPKALHFDAIVLPTEAFKRLRHAKGPPTPPKEDEGRAMWRNKYAEFDGGSVEDEREGWRYLEEGTWSAIILTMRDPTEITCLVVGWEDGKASRVGICYLENAEGCEMKVEWQKRRVCLA